MLGQQDYQVTYLTIEDGLPTYDNKRCIMDDMGYIWIAGEGLTKYDGKSFKPYKIEKGSDEVVQSFIMDVFQSPDGRFWVLERANLYEFFPQTGGFERTPFTIGLDEEIPFEFLGINGFDYPTLWINCVKGGFLSYHVDNQKTEQFNLTHKKLNNREQFVLNGVADIKPYKSNDSLLLISSNTGLYFFNRIEKKLKKSEVVNFNSWGVYNDEKGIIWGGTWGDGIYRYDVAAASVTFHSPLSDLGLETMNNGFSHFIKNDDHTFWVSSRRGGVVLVDAETGKGIKPINKNEFEKLKDTRFGTGRINKDAHGRIWAMANIGVAVYDNNVVHFTSRKFPQNFIEKDHFFDVSDAEVDRDGNYWISASFQTTENAIRKFNSSFTSSTAYGFEDESQSRNDWFNVWDLEIDLEGDVWLVDDISKSLNKLNKNTGKFEKIDKGFFRNSRSAWIELSHTGSNGNLWFATGHGGIIKYDVQKDQFKQFVVEDENELGMDRRSAVSTMYVGQDGKIWISTDAYGIYVFDPLKESFVEHFNTSFGKKGEISETPKIVGVASTDGFLLDINNQSLWLVNDKMELQREIKDKEGQPIIKIGHGVTDHNGDIWLWSYDFLYKVDTSYDVSRYGLREGIINLSGWTTDIDVLDNGEIFIGKKDQSFHIFHPDSIPFNSSQPPVAFQDITVAGEPLEFEKELAYLDEITLLPNQNFFSISFAALNFTHPDKNQYAYKMEGLHDDWVQNDNDNKAVFTDLREGDYTFRVKAANNDGVWNEDGISLKIKVLPPWYRSKVAYLIYFGLMLGSGYLFWKYQKRRWELQADLKMEQAEATRLKELDETKNRLYTNITHEFRTPLTVISGIAEELEGNDGKKERILRNSHNLLHLVNQMLDLSKLQSGQIKYSPTLIEIIPYLHYLTDSFASLANEKQISLNFHSEINELAMDTDTEKLKMVVGNLISNAIKFTPEYGKVMVTAMKNGNNKLCLKVKDNGMGMPVDQLPMIFDRFYQVDATATRKGEGTGIGLAIVKEFTELMGGKVSVNTKMGKGSEFILILPITTHAPRNVSSKPLISESLTERQEVTDTENLTSNKPANSPSVLIIEDNSDVAFYIEGVLKSAYLTTHVRNGKLGVESATEHIPDLILCDVMMPEMDGFEVCEKLKEDERTSHIPIILLTAKATQDDKIEGLEHGADAYLTKPFDKRELLVRVEKLLQKQQRLQSYFTKNATLPKEEIIENEFLQKVFSVIEENYHDETFDLLRLCRAVHLERTQLYRKIKALTGLPPSELIKKYRLNKAKELLMDSEKTISEVAYAVGFKNAGHFTQSFKKEFNQLPKEWTV